MMHLLRIFHIHLNLYILNYMIGIKFNLVLRNYQTFCFAFLCYPFLRLSQYKINIIWKLLIKFVNLILNIVNIIRFIIGKLYNSAIKSIFSCYDIITSKHFWTRTWTYLAMHIHVLIIFLWVI